MWRHGDLQYSSPCILHKINSCKVCKYGATHAKYAKYAKYIKYAKYNECVSTHTKYTHLAWVDTHLANSKQSDFM